MTTDDGLLARVTAEASAACVRPPRTRFAACTSTTAACRCSAVPADTSRPGGMSERPCRRRASRRRGRAPAHAACRTWCALPTPTSAASPRAAGCAPRSPHHSRRACGAPGPRAPAQHRPRRRAARIPRCCAGRRRLARRSRSGCPPAPRMAASVQNVMPTMSADTAAPSRRVRQLRGQRRRRDRSRRRRD